MLDVNSTETVEVESEATEATKKPAGRLQFESLTTEEVAAVKATATPKVTPGIFEAVRDAELDSGIRINLAETDVLPVILKRDFRRAAKVCKKRVTFPRSPEGSMLVVFSEPLPSRIGRKRDGSDDIAEGDYSVNDEAIADDGFVAPDADAGNGGRQARKQRA